MMIGRKSFGTPQMEVTSSSNSSPLRRRSLLLQKSTVPNLINQNDDTAERMARRQEVSTPLASTPGGERRSLGLRLGPQIPPAQLAENIAQCIKLFAQNKITVTNAFSLNIIDFMAMSVRKQDGNMDNLQVASSSLDVSAKVYGCRVDSLYANALQMAGDKTAGTNDEKEQNPDPEQQDGDGEMAVDDNHVEVAKKNPTKKNKRNQGIFPKPEEALKGKLELDRPTQLMMGEIDNQSSDNLDGAMLPLHARRPEYSMAQFHGIVFDVIEEPEEEISDLELPVSDVGDCSSKVIAESFRTFDFMNWNLDEEEQMEVDEDNDPSLDPNAFHFDPDGSLPADNEPQRSIVNFFDMEEQVNVNANANAFKAREDIVDFRSVIVSSGIKRNPEYSYFHNSIKLQLVGPSHWKVRGLTTRPANTTKETEVIAKQAKKKKDLVMSFDLKQKEEATLKFDESKVTKRQAKIRRDTWSEMRNLCPYDSVDEDDEGVFYIRPDIKYPSSDNPEINALNASDDPHYDYDNPHDVTNFCPNVQDEDQYHGEDNRSPDIFENELCTQGAFVGDNLIAMPALPNTNNIQFAQRAKKIDMKHLKKSIWMCLTTNKKNTDKENLDIQSAVEQAEKEITNEKSFVEDVYKQLPNYLSQSSAGSLSLSIAFVSLLHLTNEKCLKLSVTPKMDDLTIKKD